MAFEAGSPLAAAVIFTAFVVSIGLGVLIPHDKFDLRMAIGGGVAILGVPHGGTAQQGVLVERELHKGSCHSALREIIPRAVSRRILRSPIVSG